MNFLAHSLFANGSTERVAGQFCGDFVRGSDLSQFTEGIQEGIRRHRRIDAFTDRHPEVKLVHDLFKPPIRRFAGIITDVSFDYFLANDWQRYCEQPLEAHVAWVHEALNKHLHELPPQLQRFIAFIQRENVLLGNREFRGVELTLQRLSMRSSRWAPMADAGPVVWAHREALAACFATFFPTLLSDEQANWVGRKGGEA